MGRGIRNRSKAYDVNDNLKPEYSIKINGGVYPLMSGTFKGFTSKTSKNGSTRFNKIFHGTQEEKQNYINKVKGVLNWNTAKADVGDVNAGHMKDANGNDIEKDTPMHVNANGEFLTGAVENNESKKVYKNGDKPNVMLNAGSGMKKSSNKGLQNLMSRLRKNQNKINAGKKRRPRIPLKHRKKHSKPHIKSMKKDMKEGDTFDVAHNKAIKKVGAGVWVKDVD